MKCHPPVDPVELVHHILMDVMKSKKKKSRFCQRLIPVSAVCHTNMKDIEKCVTDVFVPYFYQESTLLKFAVVYKARNNQDVDREDIIKTLASLVTRSGDYPHVVDLRNPDLTIIVEIIKNNFCISVVKDFSELKRYNIQSLMETFEDCSQSEVTTVETLKEGEQCHSPDNSDEHEASKVVVGKCCSEKSTLV
jgi:tRNA acetyltransferase TAN1